MLDKAYVEITNICNLNCDFCAGHNRKKEFMSCENFSYILSRLENKIKYLYLHLMGEPLLHPELSKLLNLTDAYDLKVMLTTNGTLLEQCADILLNCKKLFKVSISLHSFEGNDISGLELDKHLESCFDFAERSSKHGIITVFRLWNKGSIGSANAYILGKMHERFEGEWQTNRSGYKICDKLFLEWGAKFKWPGGEAEGSAEGMFCQALRDQLGILVDGTVVPCCLDHDGALALGNIFKTSIEDILSCKRAKNIYNGFSRHQAVEDYCKGCRQPCTYNLE